MSTTDSPNKGNGHEQTTTTKTPSVEELQKELKDLEAKLNVKDKMFSDTQASFTKKAKELAQVKAEAEFAKQYLTPEVTEQLEELKASDPEAWHKKLLDLEKSKSNFIGEQVEKETSGISYDKQLEERALILERHNATSSVKITDDVLANDVPPRIHKQLELGKLTYEDYIKKVSEYLTTNKVVVGEHIDDEPNIGNTTPSNTDTSTATKPKQTKVLL